MEDQPKRPGAQPDAKQASAKAEILPPQVNSQPRGTEALLDALIGECHRLVREVAAPSMAAMTDPLERRLFMQSAVSFIEAGAKVGDTVARLRSGAAQNETRHRVLVEHVAPPLAPMRDGPSPLLEDDGEGWGEEAQS